MGLAGAGLAAYAGWIEPRRLRVVRHELRPALWRREHGTLRIGVLSDLHAAWPHVTAPRIARIVARLMAEEPDIVLLPGDFISTGTRFVRPLEIDAIMRALAPLTVRPTFAVLGNHDHAAGGWRVREGLERVGIEVLQNRVVRHLHGNHPFEIAGIGCMRSGRAAIGRTLAALSGELPAILLSHVPDVFPRLPPHVALTVAGHTHGGQVRIPGLGPPVTMSSLPRHMALGLHRDAGRFLYVSGGIGTSGLPVRFGVPPEIALLTLAAG
ncbi:metallophosphoesterase [Geminicoccaceae bacterium 1502E]|nr:metallophosphoesterase [Geminicoccaceae bacterium 1502E]